MGALVQNLSGCETVYCCLERAVVETNHWLSQNVVHFPKRARHELESDAALLLMQLEHPETPRFIEKSETLTVEYTPEGVEIRIHPTGYRVFLPSGAKFVFTMQEATAKSLTLDEGEVLLKPREKVVVHARDNNM